jgi:hypothetical protein
MPPFPPHRSALFKTEFNGYRRIANPHQFLRASHSSEGANWESHHAKVDRNNSVADPGRQFGSDCADDWFAKSSRTSIDELGPAIAAGCRTGRPPPAARRSGAPGEKPDGSKRSSQSRERSARPYDQRHLPRLLNTTSAATSHRPDAALRRELGTLSHGHALL